MTLDFTGTDPQVKGPINSPLATTLGSGLLCHALRHRCLDPGNEGCKRPISVIAPPGTLVNARVPSRRLSTHDRLPFDRRPGHGRACPGDARAGDGGFLRLPLQLHDRHATRSPGGEPFSAKSFRGNRCNRAGRRHRRCRLPRDQLPYPADRGDRDGIAGSLPGRELRSDSGGPGSSVAASARSSTYRILGRIPGCSTPPRSRFRDRKASSAGAPGRRPLGHQRRAGGRTPAGTCDRDIEPLQKATR